MTETGTIHQMKICNSHNHTACVTHNNICAWENVKLICHNTQTLNHPKDVPSHPNVVSHHRIWSHDGDFVPHPIPRFFTSFVLYSIPASFHAVHYHGIHFHNEDLILGVTNTNRWYAAHSQECDGEVEGGVLWVVQFILITVKDLSHIRGKENTSG